MGKVVQFSSYRRFGVEIELNTTSGDVKELGEGELPEGAHDVAKIVSDVARHTVEVHSWHHTHNNDAWVVKPDRSCGIELCSPVLKGWEGLKSVLQVVEALSYSGVSADERCSLHVHVNVADLPLNQMGSVVARYIKSELTIMEAMPRSRRANRYCQCIGMSDLIDHSTVPSPSALIHRVSMTKYHSLNAYHMRKSKRRTMEFRVGDNTMCLDPYAVKNWVRFLLHFVETTKGQGMPPQYRLGNKWTGLVWLEPEDVLMMLCLDKENLSLGMRQARDWFLSRLLEGTADESPPHVWSAGARSHTLEALRPYLECPVEKVLYEAEYTV